MNQRQENFSLAPLIEYLDQNRDSIAKIWTDLILTRLPHSRYATYSREELLAQGAAWVQLVIDSFESGSIANQPKAGFVSPKYLYDYGFRISEIVDVTLIGNEIVTDIVKRVYGSREKLGTKVDYESLIEQVRKSSRYFINSYFDIARQQIVDDQQRKELLLSMAYSSSSTLDLSVVLEYAAVAVAAASDAERCWFFLKDGDSGQEAFFYGPGGLSSGTLSMKSPCYQAMVEKRPVTCFDAQNDPRVDHVGAAKVGLKSFLAVPLISRDKVLGVAQVMSFKEQREFTNDQINLTQGITSIVATAIENARLHQKVEELAVYEERARLGRDLHDTLAQDLGYLRCQIALARELLQNREADQLKDLLAQLEEAAEQSYQNLREAIFCLRASAVEGEIFLTQLRDYLDNYSEYYGLGTEIIADFDPSGMITQKAETQLPYVILEALTNIRKHAQGRKVLIHFERIDNRLRVTIKDDGTGFDAKAVAGQGTPHWGLRTMQERAESVGGAFMIDTAPGRGTQVIVDIPLLPELYNV